MNGAEPPGKDIFFGLLRKAQEKEERGKVRREKKNKIKGGRGSPKSKRKKRRMKSLGPKGNPPRV